MHGSPDQTVIEDTTAQPALSLGQSILRSSIGLGIFAVVTAGVIAITQLSTSATIADNIQKAQSRTLYELVPAHLLDNDPLKDTVSLQPDATLGNKTVVNVHIARKQGQVVALLFPVTNPHGYSGNIDMLVAVNANGELAGVRVLSHKETPGLGDKVETKKSSWIHSLTGLSLEKLGLEGWRVKKDGGQIDQFTGATITPRAVVGQTRAVLQYFEQHKAELLNHRVVVPSHTSTAQ